MICKIADLIVDIPTAGGLASRCKEYLHNGNDGADVVIRADLYCPEKYPSNMTEENVAYMESARQFYAKLLEFDGFYLHASAVAMDGKAYLFSANPGVGKSTHSRLWKQQFGEKAQIFNDDKPALRCLDGVWYAYGTPWCGKDGININMKVPLAGICFLKRGQENKIRPLSALEALQRILPQTIYRIQTEKKMDYLIRCVNDLLVKIPVFELENKPEAAAAKLSYETMSAKAKELGL